MSDLLAAIAALGLTAAAITASLTAIGYALTKEYA